MWWKKPGGVFLTLALAILLLMFVLAVTPVLWILGGRESESYPEYLALGVGVPFGLLCVLVASVRFWMKNKTHPSDP
ncbi:MAG TPA: hypothetical protein VJS12_02790 [Steroidobacteraceae bacterium]|nr:hypothetical protein [Steroidobacteraceae bacterium]